MKARLRTHLTLEVLEDRSCPSISAMFDGTNLTLGDGFLNGAPTNGVLTIT
jgi:hypothetical protein